MSDTGKNDPAVEEKPRLMQGWIKVSISALFLAIGVGIAFYVGICTFESMAELTWKMVFDAPSGSQLRHFVLIGIVILCSLFLILLTLHLAFRLFETLAIAEEDEKRRKAKLEEEKIKAESLRSTKDFFDKNRPVCCRDRGRCRK